MYINKCRWNDETKHQSSWLVIAFYGFVYILSMYGIIWIIVGHLKNLAMLHEMLWDKRWLVRLFPALEANHGQHLSNMLGAFPSVGQRHVHIKNKAILQITYQQFQCFNENKIETMRFFVWDTLFSGKLQSHYVSRKFAIAILSPFIPIKLRLNPNSLLHKSPCSDPDHVEVGHMSHYSHGSPHIFMYVHIICVYIYICMYVCTELYSHHIPI